MRCSLNGLSDPSAEAAAIDLGVSPRPGMLRAPDIAGGPIPDEPGWATEAPPLAVELPLA